LNIAFNKKYLCWAQMPRPGVATGRHRLFAPISWSLRTMRRPSPTPSRAGTTRGSRRWCARLRGDIPPPTHAARPRSQSADGPLISAS